MDRAEELRGALQQNVERGDVAGAGVLIFRDGTTEFAAAGWRDIEGGLPVERDTLFRIASMTKPITSVAALMLMEEGRFRLEDPIASVAPEFAEMRVLRSAEGSLTETDPASRPITFDDLLTHRAGFTYADFHFGPIAQAYRDALGLDIDSELTPDEWVRRLAGLPLVAQPGTAMTYGVATDLLGFLIARMEGSPLGEVLRRRIFDPLGMEDTCFTVPLAKRARRASSYGFDDQGRMVKTPARKGAFVEERPEAMAYESGGAGLWSTADDYLKFARLFLGDGEVDGVRLLRPETLKLMMTNRLTDAQRANTVLLGQKIFATGRGFGLGVSVVLEPDAGDMSRRGSAGTVSWPGAFGGWWLADPVEDLVFLFLAQNMVDLPQMMRGIGLGVWAAIDTAQKIALR